MDDNGPQLYLLTRYEFVIEVLQVIQFHFFYSVACDNGWKHYISSCYQYFNRQSRWTDARKLCQNIGADLAKITSRDVHDFVFGLGSHQPFDIWIGLRQQVVENRKRFVWTDGSHLGNFTFWSGGEPRQGQDVCVEMLRSDNNGQWRTGECTTKHSSYVCQKGMFSCLLPLGHTPEWQSRETPPVASHT